MLQNKKISYLPGPSAEEISSFASALKVTPIVAGVLLRRGMTDMEECREFLYGKKEPFGDPFGIKNMAEAVDRIVTALSKGEHVTIYGDYDVDGITASSLLFLYLKEAGAKVDVYIPRRDSEGYGLNSNALEYLAEKGTDLLITVDSGISGYEEVAKSAPSMDIIITDHHMPPEKLPPAYAIINPHQKGDTYSCEDLSGAGVAFKLCQALEQKLKGNKDFWDKYVELAALGTVADLVPLLGENREIVRAGLKQIAHTTNPGLSALIKVAGVENKPITSEIVGFVLAPRMNAAGRLDDAMDVVRLLTTEDLEEANAIAIKLNEENITRQNISKKIYEEAEEMLEVEPLGSALVLGSEGWHPGVIGIVASRLVDKYHRPTILLSIDGEKAKGSCRSIPPVNMYETLGLCRDLLEQFGGHSQAAGLSLKASDIPSFRKAFQEEVTKVLGGKPYIPVVEPDYYVPKGQELTVDTVNSLSLLEPYGQSNPSPIFAFKEAQVINASTMGKDHNHLRLNIAQGAAKYKGISWNAGDLAPGFYSKEVMAMAFAPKINSFQGRESVDLMLIAVNPLRKIFDYRTSLIPREEILKNILQSEEKTVVYVGNTSSLPVLPPKTVVLDPTCTELPEGSEKVVLYDNKAAELLLTKPFWLEGKTDVVLYLLYKREDFLDARSALRRTYPDADLMRSCYKVIRTALKNGGDKAANFSELMTLVTPEGVQITDDILQVFSELKFITLDTGRKTAAMGTPSFNPLTNSPTFTKMSAEYEKRIKEINTLTNITSAEIAAVWK